MLGASLFFGTHGVWVRFAVGEGADPLVISFWRSLVLLLLILPWIVAHRRTALRSTHPLGQLLRVAFSMAGLIMLVVAQANLPLAEVSALTFAAPLFGMMGAALFLGEAVRARRWIATLVATALNDDAARPQNVAGLVTIAAAADFTEDLLPARLGPQALAQIAETGFYAAPSEYADEPYVITSDLLAEGHNHLVLKTPLALKIPVRLIHGTADPDVPWTQSQKLMNALTSDDVELILIKNGDHRLSEPHDLARMVGVVERLCDQLSGNSAASPAR